MAILDRSKANLYEVITTSLQGGGGGGQYSCPMKKIYVHVKNASLVVNAMLNLENKE